MLNLPTKRAKTLHIGPANFYRFTDPSRALCLELADAPTADRPPVGMRDSARCPQATHHPCHRAVRVVAEIDAAATDQPEEDSA
ncbi:hypothetical protein [Kitasatospora sp. NA04385]|uniref:hypothetical protein n=1 Tax=Kitasatospora sp. NA04385 TaxID=2742135 RepID=UPI001C37910D|nr:hypothetical protein [Kitasatospora sp. NA04385]